MQAGAIAVAALGLVMFSNGWSISKFTGNAALSKPAPAQSAKPTSNSSPPMPVIQNGEQIVNSILQPNRYPAITVQQGVPVRWTINAPAGSINGCNNSIIIREYGIQYAFKHGDNVIKFNPIKAGRFLYTCWMGMIKSTITVVAKRES